MVKSPIHFHCVLHAKKRRGRGVFQIALAHILNRRPFDKSNNINVSHDIRKK